MAVRTPLFLNGTDLQEMNVNQINSIKDRVRYLYGAAAPVALSVVGSGGNLGTIYDTRKTAGAYSSSATSYPSEATTAEPGTVTISYSRVNQTTGSQTQPADTDNKNWPMYWDGSAIRSMSTTDMLDTFVRPAVVSLAAYGQPGTYTIHTSGSLSGYTLMSSTPVFSDTRANTGEYSAGGIPEAADQPFTVTNYYLLRKNNIAAPVMTAPLYLTASNEIQQFGQSGFDADMQDLVRWAALYDTGYRIRYNWNGAGASLGMTAMNSVLTGAGNYQTRFVNANDYRAQEFPDGGASFSVAGSLKVNLV
jgi:hypothetical protein